MTLKITWPDGRTTEHASADAFLADLRSEQWTEMTDADLRRVLAHRARVWSDSDVETRGTAAQLVAALDAAGLLSAEEDAR